MKRPSDKNGPKVRKRKTIFHIFFYMSSFLISSCLHFHLILLLVSLQKSKDSYALFVILFLSNFKCLAFIIIIIIVMFNYYYWKILGFVRIKCRQKKQKQKKIFKLQLCKSCYIETKVSSPSTNFYEQTSNPSTLQL